jgi:hypothetical protein
MYTPKRSARSRSGHLVMSAVPLLVLALLWLSRPTPTWGQTRQLSPQDTASIDTGEEKSAPRKPFTQQELDAFARSKDFAKSLLRTFQQRLGSGPESELLILNNTGYVPVAHPVVQGKAAEISFQVEFGVSESAAETIFYGMLMSVTGNWVPQNQRGWDNLAVHNIGIIGRKGSMVVGLYLSGEDYRPNHYDWAAGIADFVLNVVEEINGTANGRIIKEIKSAPIGPLGNQSLGKAWEPLRLGGQPTLGVPAKVNRTTDADAPGVTATQGMTLITLIAMLGVLVIVGAILISVVRREPREK